MIKDLIRWNIYSISFLQENLAALRHHFPGWLLRLYVDHQSLDAATMDQLIDLGANPAMDLCIGLEHEGLKMSSRNGMLWRFLPILDQLVDVREGAVDAIII